MVHTVKMEVPKVKSVLNKDVIFEISNSAGKLGELHISKGNIEWLPAGAFGQEKTTELGEICRQNVCRRRENCQKDVRTSSALPGAYPTQPIPLGAKSSLRAVWRWTIRGGSIPPSCLRPNEN